jgi:hypothetical protein
MAWCFASEGVLALIHRAAQRGTDWIRQHHAFSMKMESGEGREAA